MLTLPKPKNDYLVALSTPHGIMQHTMFNLPDPEYGYSTDDNARALIVAHMWKNRDKKKAVIMRSLETAYLRFLKFAQGSDGQFYCYVSFDLQKKELGVGDWFARSVFALAFLTFNSRKFEKVSWELLQKSLPLFDNQPYAIRTTAFLIMSIYYIFKKHEKNGHLKRQDYKRLENILKKWCIRLEKKAHFAFTKNWRWPEKAMTYDNGKVIQAYIMLGHLLNEKKMLTLGQTMLDFYIKKTFKKGYFQAPGNHGFWTAKQYPSYDEQAIEAYSMIAAAVSAYNIYKVRKYLILARKTYWWFWGKNRLNLSLVDKKTGAVFDGLGKENVNPNQGAEGYLALNLAYFTLTEKMHL